MSTYEWLAYLVVFVLLIYCLHHEKQWYNCNEGQCAMFDHARKESSSAKEYYANLLSWLARYSYWKRVFIVSVLSTILIAFLVFKRMLSFYEFSLIFIAVFLPVYFSASFSAYHLVEPTTRTVASYIASV